MDTKHDLFFWIERLAKDDTHGCDVLYGHDFEGGLNSLMGVGSSLWLASSHSTIPLEGRVELWHSQGRGWTLRFFEGSIKTIPCLLCSDAAVRCVFQGWVHLDLNDQARDLPSLIGKGMPLCGKDWLGVVRSLPDGCFLEAFGRSDAVSVDESMAYCPWWSGSLEDVDGFRVKVSVIDAVTPPKISESSESSDSMKERRSSGTPKFEESSGDCAKKLGKGGQRT